MDLCKVDNVSIANTLHTTEQVTVQWRSPPDQQGNHTDHGNGTGGGEDAPSAKTRPGADHSLTLKC